MATASPSKPISVAVKGVPNGIGVNETQSELVKVKKSDRYSDDVEKALKEV